MNLTCSKGEADVRLERFLADVTRYNYALLGTSGQDRGRDGVQYREFWRAL